MQKVLYLGLDPTRWPSEDEIVHLPLIRIEPRPFCLPPVQKAFAQMVGYTHILFTSRSPVALVVDYAQRMGFSYDILKEKTYLCLGEATASRLNDFNLQAHHVADTPCGEGVVQLLEQLSLEEASLFFPHSALGRKLVCNSLQQRKIEHCALELYTTLPNRISLPDLTSFDEIVFTSSSTVEIFKSLCPVLPPFNKCRSIGPLTAKTLEKIYGVNREI